MFKKIIITLFIIPSLGICSYHPYQGKIYNLERSRILVASIVLMEMENRILIQRERIMEILRGSDLELPGVELPGLEIDDSDRTQQKK